MNTMSLADAMVRAKVGVGELSRRTGCSTSAIRNYVTEEQRPRIETAARLVQGLLEEDRQAVLASWGYEGTVERDTVDPMVAVLWEVQAQTKLLQALVRDVRTLCVHVQQVATNTDPTIYVDPLGFDRVDWQRSAEDLEMAEEYVQTMQEMVRGFYEYVRNGTEEE